MYIYRLRLCFIHLRRRTVHHLHTISYWSFLFSARVRYLYVRVYYEDEKKIYKKYPNYIQRHLVLVFKTLLRYYTMVRVHVPYTMYGLYMHFIQYKYTKSLWQFSVSTPSSRCRRWNEGRLHWYQLPVHIVVRVRIFYVPSLVQVDVNSVEKFFNLIYTLYMYNASTCIVHEYLERGCGRKYPRSFCFHFYTW